MFPPPIMLHYKKHRLLENNCQMQVKEKENKAYNSEKNDFL